MIIHHTLKLWTYGGTPLGNPGPGGWAYVLRDGVRVYERSGCEPEATNNTMELCAAIAGLMRTPSGSTVVVHSDSQYVVNGASRWIPGWKRGNWRIAKSKGIANLRLWKALDHLMASRQVEWQWVRQGAGGPDHQTCIDSARRAARTMAQDRDTEISSVLRYLSTGGRAA